MRHQFRDQQLLEVALTHTSHAYEQGGEHNERLEFLGDAVLQLCVTEQLYARFPVDREGVLHGYRTQLVSTGHLADLARRWGLDSQVRLGKGELATGGRTKDRLLAGVFEAVLGAIYLDGGYGAAQADVEAVLRPDFDQLSSASDPRKVLHEWSQKNHGTPPEYIVKVQTGPAHDRRFVMEVSCGGQVLSMGEGTSKKSATIEAAKAALALLSKR